MEVKIQSEDLKAAIYIELRDYKRECVITEEELGKINDLSLQQYNVHSEKKDIDLRELAMFRNLNSLLLSKFEIDDDIMKVLNSRSKLEAIQFSGCKFSNIIPFEIPLKYLILDRCENFLESTMGKAEMIRIIGNRDLDLQKVTEFMGIKKLYLQNCIIDNFECIKKFTDLTYLNLDGSKVDRLDIIEELRQHIKVDFREKYRILAGN